MLRQDDTERPGDRSGLLTDIKMDESTPPTLRLGKYRHSKTGHLYEVIGTALQTETGEQLVIYRPLCESKHQLFARPYGMFVGDVDIDGQPLPRFVLVDKLAIRS